MPGGLPEAIIARFRSVALERVSRIEASWLALTQGNAGHEVAAEMLHDLHTLKGDSRVVGFTEVTLVCHKLEDLLVFARAHDYRVLDDFDLAVTMALGFVSMLIKKRDGGSIGGIDLSGFVGQIDDALREAEAVPVPAPASRASRRPSVPAIEGTDRVS